MMYVVVYKMCASLRRVLISSQGGRCGRTPQLTQSAPLQYGRVLHISCDLRAGSMHERLDMGRAGRGRLESAADMATSDRKIWMDGELRSKCPGPGFRRPETLRVEPRRGVVDCKDKGPPCLSRTALGAFNLSHAATGWSEAG